MTSRNGRVLLAGAGIALLLCTITAGTGCSKREPKPDVVTLEGKVESVKRTSDNAGTITVSYYSKERDEEMVGTGDVTPETEILIGGAVATLADIREGDRVRGDVRVEKIDGKRTQSILRINIERPK